MKIAAIQSKLQNSYIFVIGETKTPAYDFPPSRRFPGSHCRRLARPVQYPTSEQSLTSCEAEQWHLN